MNDFSNNHSYVADEINAHNDSITIRRPKKCQVNIAVDRDLEEIAKIEVDAFLNQGKILTDKNLKQVEKSIKDQWISKRGTNGLCDFQLKQNWNKKNLFSHFYSKTKRDTSSITPNCKLDEIPTSWMENVYQDKGREGNRWSNILSRNKQNIVSHLTDKINNSRNKRYFDNCKSNYRYTYLQDNRKTDSRCKVNTLSREKLPSNIKLESSMIWNKGDSNNDKSLNSIVVKGEKERSTLTTPIRTANSKSWLVKNNSSSKLQNNNNNNLQADANKIINDK